jgi:type I restriction enzyme M protein
MSRTRKIARPQTTAQQLGSIVKSSRDIMRKDKGLSGDIDRLPMLTWIMFLKFLDDMKRKLSVKAASEIGQNDIEVMALGLSREFKK